MNLKFSNTRLELYKTCGFKYYLKYVLGYEPDLTFSSLLFGKSIDNALNELLLSKKEKKEINKNEIIKHFEENMNEWKGQNRFIYFKNEIPNELKDIKEIEQTELEKFVHENLIKIGKKMIETYIEKILPQFNEIIDVQVKKTIKNEEGDELIIIVDFLAKMNDGKVVLFDNKTSSNLYPTDCLENSQQLNLYSEYFPDIENIGYVVLQKKIVDDSIPYQILIGKPNEKKREEVFNEIIDTIDRIKDNRFDKNEKSCYSFGRPCEYYLLCKFNNKKGFKKNV